MTRRRRTFVALALVAGTVLVVPAGAAVWGWSALHRAQASWEGPSVDVWIEPGLDAGSMLERLAEAGVVRSPGLVRAWLHLRGGAEKLRAGEYRFDRPVSPLGVLERLTRGDVLLHPVTLPEGLNLFEIAERVAATGLASRADLLEQFEDPTPIRDLDPDARDLEGYLYPDTYHFPRGVRPGGIVAAMLARFREVVGTDYASRAASVGLDLRQAVVLASLIEKETSVADERGRISGVFHNRLARGMRLECDPTVMYALLRAGRPVRLLSLENLKFESPWNTYRIRGLPVGPIANPGRASLEAAVEPLASEDYYFVAAPGGGHRFSKNLAEHLQAVKVWRNYSRSSR